MDLEYIYFLRCEFEDDTCVMLATLRKNASLRSQGGWQRYRDVHTMFSETRQSLALAEDAVTEATASPSKKNIANVKNKLEYFNNSWHTAKEYSLIGMLSI